MVRSGDHLEAARGRGAEYWGEGHLETDRWVRTVDMPGIARRWYGEQAPTGKIIVDAFAAGINAYAAAHPDLDVAGLMKRATPVLSDAEAAAYAAPFPDSRFKAGVRRFPELVQTSPDMQGVAEGRAAVEFLSKKWSGDSFMAVGMQDPVLGPEVMHWLRGVIRGCPEPMKVTDGGHFLQEWGGPIAGKALEAFGLS